MGSIVVVVKPGSRVPGISVDGEGIVVRVSAPAQDGRANEAVRAALADALDIPRRSVHLIRGGAARSKTFELDGLERTDALARLARN